MHYSVSQLARRVGISVRALHHFEALGLLRAARTAAGYRRYGDEHVRRLHRILALRQLGIALKDIGPLLQADALTLSTLLARQEQAVTADIERLVSLRARLQRLRSLERVEPTDLLELMSTMHTLENHCRPDELTELHALRSQIAPERAVIAAELRALIEGFRAAAERGDAPATVGDLATRWIALGRLAPASEALRARARALIDGEAQVQRATGIDAPLRAYIDAAVAAVNAAG